MTPTERIVGRIRHAWAAAKLRRGRCQWCRTAMPQDRDVFCSEACALEHE